MVTSDPWQSEYEPLAFNTIHSSPALETNKASYFFFQSRFSSLCCFPWAIAVLHHLVNSYLCGLKFKHHPIKMDQTCESNQSEVFKQCQSGFTTVKHCRIYSRNVCILCNKKFCLYKIIKVQIIIQNTDLILLIQLFKRPVFLKEIDTFIQQGLNKLIKSDSEGIIVTTLVVINMHHKKDECNPKHNL